MRYRVAGLWVKTADSSPVFDGLGSDPQHLEALQDWNARQRGNVERIHDVREQRHRMFVETMFLAEESLIPFPDDILSRKRKGGEVVDVV